MHSLYRAIFVAAITFGASVVGMLLQWAVPADVLTAKVDVLVPAAVESAALGVQLSLFSSFSIARHLPR